MIADMWLACYSETEIAKEVECDQKTVNNFITELSEEELGKSDIWQKFLVLSEYKEPDFTPPPNPVI